MIKLHKIPDCKIFKAIFAIIVLFNLKYFFLIFQIPFTLLFADYMDKNPFKSQVSAIQKTTSGIKDFQDEGKVGFTSDTLQANVFDLQDSIKAFYIAQYAIVPSILKNDTDKNYVIGSYATIPLEEPKLEGFGVYKKINDTTYIFRKSVK